MIVLFCFKDTIFFNFAQNKTIMKSVSFILLGTNMGDRESLLVSAIKHIGESCGDVVACSKIYETEPWGFKAENNFLNQVIKIETSLLPHELLKELLSIEAVLGRQRIEGVCGYQSRSMDLDILYYDDIIVDDADLILPHPRLHLRRFTLLPLCDIASDFVHPLLCKTNKKLLEECEDKSDVRVM